MFLSYTNITVENIVSALAAPLPGPKAHLSMLPEGRELILPAENHNIKKSAVLMLIYPENSQLYFCVTKRNSGLKHHPGQISFPGGRCEKHENDAWLTALRETEEEIGVPQNRIRIVGKLSDVFVSVSNFNIHPYIGYVPEKPQFSINHHEVEALMTLPLSKIFPVENHTSRKVHTSSGPMNVPCYLIDGEIIWGATSMMIAELEAILRQYYSRREAH